MKTLHILIVEDEPLVAMDLEILVTEFVTATVVVKASVAATKQVLHEALDFAFLDVDVTNGKTFEVAQILDGKHVPFVFISGSPQDQLPFDLRSAPFIPKPFYPAQIERALQIRRHGTTSRIDASLPPQTNQTYVYTNPNSSPLYAGCALEARPSAGKQKSEIKHPTACARK